MEGDKSIWNMAVRLKHFYPRPPHGGRHYDNVQAYTDFDFYPRPPHGGRRAEKLFERARQEISTHALRMEGDFSPRLSRLTRQISTHALRMEGDLVIPSPIACADVFLPTPSAWRATSAILKYPSVLKFLPTPSAWRATARARLFGCSAEISTHALTWRATRHILQDCRDFVNFYPRPHMEGDQAYFAGLPRFR